MICFGIKTDQKVNKMDMWVPLLIKKKKNIKIYSIWQTETEGKCKIFIFYFFLSILSSIYGNRTVRIRRGKKQSDVLDEGYAWEPKTRDFAEFLIKIRKILCFGFSQIYGFLTVRIDRSKRSN